ncbi:type I restriction endonuclease [Limnoraphis robusta]|uniref:Type I restriction endonuclease subunit R n=1 Tax=Limnoraphis robusta CS-951 TaxID=1637645 RepID=A0A0F5YDJ7_9CYAN|nr:type I restriction endonuclease [Limnoraphis robusta]KKD36951.1 type I restriction endonuclease subunit R [Limnoraphis robusta CS-951]KMW70703.1 type I restriction endonuclease subunit R [Limnoraphis robusta CS-951]
MTQIQTITEVFTCLAEVETRLNLRQNKDLLFFPEWYDQLPSLTPAEENSLDRVQNSYLYNSSEGSLTEATVNLIVISPLLYLAGFCDPPFKIQAEKTVEVTAADNNNIYRGRIDVLVLKNQFWLGIIESKQTRFSFSVALPQILAYMMGNPNSEQPIFGLVTNGDHFLFLKLIKQPDAEYSLSTDFSIYGLPENELYQVLKVMKRIAVNLNN